MAANRLIEAGRPQEALAYSREAIELIDVRADAVLANQLNTLARSLSATGQPAEALRVTERALAMWGELAAEQPPGSSAHIEYGGTLHNLANRLFTVGRWEDAVRTSAEVVAWYREPAGADRAGWQDKLAQALSNHALFLSNVRRRDAAMEAAAEAVTISRELASTHPVFRARLALALKEYGARLLALGRPDGRAALVQSVDLYRELAGDDRDSHLSGLAQAVNDLAVFTAAGDGLALAEEAVALRRELVTVNRAFELPGLALSMANLARKQAAAGRIEVAVVTGEQALELIREAVSANRAATTPRYANLLRHQAARLDQAGRAADAMALGTQAIAAAREALATHRTGNLTGLEDALRAQAERLSAAPGRSKRRARLAREMFREADQLRAEHDGGN